MTARLGAIILCGGRSSRMGRPKAWLPFGNERMLQRMVRLLVDVADPIAVVHAAGQSLPDLDRPVLRAIDARPDLGPLEGMAAGFATLPETTDLVYATSVDVPFLAPGWIARLAIEIGEADIAIVEAGGYLQPLAALYRRATVLPAIEGLLAADRRRPAFLIDQLATRRLDESMMRSVDPQLSTLKNMNTPADYHALLDEAGLPRGRAVIELHGVPRIRAGFARLEVCAGSARGAVEQLVAAAAGRLDGLLEDGRLHRAYKLNLNGERFVDDPDALVVDGDELLLMAADVGG
ncbi:MAG: NTP transferase domain-containing protein [Isosphaeraceae bacterium]|nr:NTP transferase domain-containing protein [Isosphaeraceae bacterium]